LGEQADEEFDAEPCASDDWLALQNRGINNDS